MFGDAKIKNTIAKFIHEEAEEGCVIIVGRAGVAILKDIPNSLHIKLLAPLNYRVDGVSRRHEISHSEARKLILEMDKNRSKLRSEFAGQKMDLVDYDLIFNSKVLKTEEIVELVGNAAKIRGLV